MSTEAISRDAIEATLKDTRPLFWRIRCGIHAVPLLSDILCRRRPDMRGKPMYVVAALAMIRGKDGVNENVETLAFYAVKEFERRMRLAAQAERAA